jgi:hypothetical protein
MIGRACGRKYRFGRVSLSHFPQSQITFRKFAPGRASLHSALRANALCFGWPDTPLFRLPMKQIFLSILTMLMVVATTLSAMVILVRATLFVTSIQSPLPRAGAILAEILLGVVLLLGTVWLATQAAVLIFAPKTDEPKGGSLG